MNWLSIEWAHARLVCIFFAKSDTHAGRVRRRCRCRKTNPQRLQSPRQRPRSNCTLWSASKALSHALISPGARDDFDVDSAE